MPNIAIKWIKEKVNGVKTKVYPITHLKAVRDDDGNTLLDILDVTKDLSATCSTAAATAKKEVEVGSFTFGTDSRLTVLFTNGISVANATLELTYTDGEGVEQTVEKPIYYRGAALGADMVKANATIQLRYNAAANSGSGAWEVIGDLYPEVEAQFVNTTLVFTKGGEFVGSTLVLD